MAFNGGTGTEFDPYLVATAAQLNEVRDFPNAYFKQTADIDLSGYTSWTPIDGFSGNYDGQNYKITNVTITATGSNNGIFGLISDGDSYANCIKNVIAPSVTVNVPQGVKADYTGGLIGRVDSMDSILNCDVKLTINIDCINTYPPASSYSEYIGGIVGFAYLNTVSDCHGTLIINNTGLKQNSKCGGLSGGITGTSVIKCTGDISGTGDMYLVGLIASSDVTTIEECCGVVDITLDNSASEFGGGGYSSGLTGNTKNGNFVNCYAMGTIVVASINNLDCYGGICADGYGCNYTNCYSAVQILNNTEGSLNYSSPFLSGEMDAFDTTITGCYYDSTLCTLTMTNENDTSVAKTTAEMKLKGTFTNWDFENVWDINPSINNGYPYFQPLTEQENPHRPGISDDDYEIIVNESDGNNPIYPIDQPILFTRISRNGKIFSTIYNEMTSIRVRDELNIIGDRTANDKFFKLNNRENLCRLFAKNEITNGCSFYSNIFYDVFNSTQYSFQRDMLGTIDDRYINYTGTISAGTNLLNSSNMNYTHWIKDDTYWNNTNYISVNIDDGVNNEEIFIKPKTLFDSREYFDNEIFPYVIQLYPGVYNISLGGGYGSGINLNKAIGETSKGGTIIAEITISETSTLEIKKIMNNGEYGASLQVYVNDTLYFAVGGGGSAGYEVIDSNFYNYIKGGDGGGTIGQNGNDGITNECTGGSGANDSTGGIGGVAINQWIDSVDGEDYPTSIGGIFDSDLPYCNGGCGYAGGGSGVGATDLDNLTYSFSGGGGGSSYAIDTSSVIVYENSQGTNNSQSYIVISKLDEIMLKTPTVNSYTNPIIYRSYITKDTVNHRATLNKLNLRINIRSIQDLLKLLSIFCKTSIETELIKAEVTYSSSANFDETNNATIPFEVMAGYDKNISRFVTEGTIEVPYASINLTFGSSNNENTSYLYELLGIIN